MRRPKNVAEGAFFDLATANGWQMTHRGWPDFFVLKGGTVAAVEVQPSASRSLGADKRSVMEALAEHGIPTYEWSPDGGFKRIESMGGKGGEDDCPEERQRINSETAREGSGEGEHLFPTQPEEPSRDGTDAMRAKVDAVWNHFVAEMEPRQVLAGDEERRIIRAALKVASVAECQAAISECKASDWHMGANPHGRKYNRLSQILKGRRGRETTRERIDFFLDLARTTTGGSSIPSADRVIVAQHQQDVQRGHRLADSPEAVEKAKRSEAWLLQRGIETVRREPDGYPTFRRLRSEERESGASVKDGD